jgi:hypothetical protein
MPTLGSPRLAYIATVQDEPVMRVAQHLRWHSPHQRVLYRTRCLPGCYSRTVA